MPNYHLSDDGVTRRTKQIVERLEQIERDMVARGDRGSEAAKRMLAFDKNTLAEARELLKIYHIELLRTREAIGHIYYGMMDRRSMWNIRTTWNGEGREPYLDDLLRGKNRDGEILNGPLEKLEA